MMKKTEKILALILCAVMIAGLLGGCQKKPKRTTKETDETTYGIDVARYQGTIRWAEAAASGVVFAMVRVGMRGMAEGEISPDSNARYNLQEAEKNGVKLRGGPIKQYIVLGNGMISVMLFFRFVSHRVMRWEVYRCSCS